MEYINGLQNVMDYYYFVMLSFYCLTIINLIVALSAKEWKRGGIKFVVVQICVFIAFVSHFVSDELPTVPKVIHFVRELIHIELIP